MAGDKDGQKSREVIDEKARDVKEFEAFKFQRIDSHQGKLVWEVLNRKYQVKMAELFESFNLTR